MKNVLFVIALLMNLNSCKEEKQNITHNKEIKKTISGSTLSYNKCDSNFLGIKKVDGTICTILLFEPKGLRLRLANKRPSYCEHNFLCVAAAFTSKSTTIDGLFIQKGKIINQTKLKILNGTCIITNDSLIIVNSKVITNKFIKDVINKKLSLFQQVLLVNNSIVVNCELFGESKFVRRALIQFENSFCVCQTNKEVTISEFQTALIKIGVVNALYLDMGGWSEGWYRNNFDGRVLIGKISKYTNKQTNWLVFEKIN